MRSAVAAVAVVAALLGGVAALAIGKATGWVDGGTRTVFVPVRSGEAGDGGVAATGEVTGTGKPLPGNDFDPSQIYRARSSGVVTIYALFGSHSIDGGGSASQGSGFVVSPDGYILTNSHVITTAGEGAPEEKPEQADEIFVEYRSGERVGARIVGYDLFDDVGLVKVDPEEHPVHPVPLGDSSRVEVGEPVAAIGSPFGQTTSLSVGVVSATERSIESLTSTFDVVDAIQTDAPINRGNSGGPLFDARGRVIGINAQIRSQTGTAEGVGFAVPINSARRSMRQLIANGVVRYAWVGISTQTVTPSLAAELEFDAPRGAAVQTIVEGSPAEKAGFRAGTQTAEFEGIQIRTGGDVIVAINGQPVSDAEDVVRDVGALEPGQHVVFTVVRDGDRVDIPVVLGVRPNVVPGQG